MKTRDQQRALYAYKEADKVEADHREEFKTGARSLPSTIQSCGLIQAFSFYHKGQKAEVRKKVAAWLENHPFFREDLAVEGDITVKLSSQDIETYRMMQAEAIEYAVWLKRATESWS
ncbi:MAG: type III-B CRISPR module-associated protein Cmr5 [Deltaproteobacteria bacterium]|nr:type III-B CRISPR module-associated protein Cmr5 [Deltaproteobacteria bacterium]